VPTAAAAAPGGACWLEYCTAAGTLRMCGHNHAVLHWSEVVLVSGSGSIMSRRFGAELLVARTQHCHAVLFAAVGQGLTCCSARGHHGGLHAAPRHRRCPA
jgi:hypothetical protein